MFYCAILNLGLGLCLVAVKRFPENTYFPEMLISGKGKYFHVFGCISKNFPENIFWCLEKKKENTNPEKHKPQPRKNSSTTTNSVRRPRRRSRSKIAIDGAISRRRDRDRRIFLSDLAIFLDRSSSGISRRRDLAKARSRSTARSRRHEISTNGAISRRRDRVRRFSSRARAFSLSLIFRKCFEGKIEV